MSSRSMKCTPEILPHHSQFGVQHNADAYGMLMLDKMLVLIRPTRLWMLILATLVVLANFVWLSQVDEWAPDDVQMSARGDQLQ